MTKTKLEILPSSKKPIEIFDFLTTEECKYLHDLCLQHRNDNHKTVMLQKIVLAHDFVKMKCREKDSDRDENLQHFTNIWRRIEHRLNEYFSDSVRLGDYITISAHQGPHAVGLGRHLDSLKHNYLQGRIHDGDCYKLTCYLCADCKSGTAFYQNATVSEAFFTTTGERGSAVLFSFDTWHSGTQICHTAVKSMIGFRVCVIADKDQDKCK